MNHLQYKYECKDGLCYLREDPAQNYQGYNEQIDQDPAYAQDPNVSPRISSPKKEDEWTIYGTNYCGFCSKAKESLEALNIPYVYHSVNAQDRMELGKLTGDYPYVPMIFKGDRFIGGFTDLTTHLLSKSSEEEVVALTNQNREPQKN